MIKSKIVSLVSVSLLSATFAFSPQYNEPQVNHQHQNTAQPARVFGIDVLTFDSIPPERIGKLKRYYYEKISEKEYKGYYRISLFN